MPEMSQCDIWASMCSAEPTLSLCGSSSSGGSSLGPVMKMYFNKDLPFYLLFKNWTPKDNHKLAGAWFGIFGLALVFEVLQVRLCLVPIWLSHLLSE